MTTAGSILDGAIDAVGTAASSLVTSATSMVSGSTPKAEGISISLATDTNATSNESRERFNYNSQTYSQEAWPGAR